MKMVSSKLATMRARHREKKTSGGGRQMRGSTQQDVFVETRWKYRAMLPTASAREKLNLDTLVRLFSRGGPHFFQWGPNGAM